MSVSIRHNGRDELEPARGARCAICCRVGGCDAGVRSRIDTPVRDDAGDEVVVSAAPCRIVSLHQAPRQCSMPPRRALPRGHHLPIAPNHGGANAIVGDAKPLDFEQLLALRPTMVVVAVDVVRGPHRIASGH
jgi:hypothetical protein